jgi:two-component system OmpR family response regulator
VGDTHVVDVHLSNLRRKLQRHAPDLRFIHTVRGVGFRLSTDLLRTASTGGGAGSSDRDLVPA